MQEPGSPVPAGAPKPRKPKRPKPWKRQPPATPDEDNIVEKAGHWLWNIMAIIGIATVLGIVLTIAGIVAIFND